MAQDGLPTPSVWWEGPQGRILSAPTTSTESVLILNRVLAEDAGIYTCRAENSVKKLSVPVHLVVTGEYDKDGCAGIKMLTLITLSCRQFRR